MIYIKNTYKYPVSFTGKKNDRDFKVEFDCLRVYSDTGNIATTGVTPMDETDYEILYATSEDFRYSMDRGLLTKSKESGATTIANTIDTLTKENEVLKNQLAEKTKEASTASTKELKAANREIASLKKQLEALKKGE